MSVKATVWVILLAVTCCATVGLLTPQPMIGDEVTHYYMLAEQARRLPSPNLDARIPIGWGGVETRHYPHVFGWHYLGALVYAATGGCFSAIQLYHILYLLQFLVVASLLASAVGGESGWTSFLFVTLLASLPVCILFGITFYQDIPVAAQILTAFLLLNSGRWLAGTLFMAFALCIKETAFPFIPSFVLLLGVWQWRALQLKAATMPGNPGARSRLSIGIRAGGRVLVSALILGMTTVWLSWAITTYCPGASFYPADAVKKVWASVVNRGWGARSTVAVPGVAKDVAKDGPAVGAAAAGPAPEIANHPGDLRIGSSWIVYWGGLVWLVIVSGFVAGRLFRAPSPAGPRPSILWLPLVGLSYVLPTAWLLRSAPDARFFLPAVPFLLLPFVVWLARLGPVRLVAAGLCCGALLQSGVVLWKVHSLRNVSGDLVEAIAFLKETPPHPARVFMYPEGNYRLFPVPHEWYLGYRLRDFWRADNETRRDMLRRFEVGGIVVKKHLVSGVDPEITNLGVYPDYFVSQIEGDSRFRKVFDNRAAVVFFLEPKE